MLDKLNTPYISIIPNTVGAFYTLLTCGATPGVANKKAFDDVLATRPYMDINRMSVEYTVPFNELILIRNPITANSESNQELYIVTVHKQDELPFALCLHASNHDAAIMFAHSWTKTHYGTIFIDSVLLFNRDTLTLDEPNMGIACFEKRRANNPFAISPSDEFSFNIRRLKGMLIDYNVDVERASLANTNLYELVALMVPAFQRNNDKWSDDRQRLFIENVLAGFRTDIFLYGIAKGSPFNTSERTFILDGWQRISALVRFLMGELTVYGGHTFKQLDAAKAIHNLVMGIKLFTFPDHKSACRFYIDMNRGITHSEADIVRAERYLTEDVAVNLPLPGSITFGDYIIEMDDLHAFGDEEMNLLQNAGVWNGTGGDWREFYRLFTVFIQVARARSQKGSQERVFLSSGFSWPNMEVIVD
jgi:hypothetical protein